MYDSCSVEGVITINQVKRIITGLSRFDHDEKRDHGYLVHLSRQGVLHRKRFADALHGGKSGALKAARAWRDEIIANHPHLSREQYAQILRKNNTSGAPGVYALRNSDDEIAGWIARWLQPGSDRYVIRKFSNSLHGAARAKQLAIAAREAGVADLVDEEWRGDGEAPSAAATAGRRKRYEAARAARNRDWRVARVRVSNVFVSLHFVCGAMLQLPIGRWPALLHAKAAARNAWSIKGYGVTWAALQVSIDAREFIHAKLAGTK